MSIALEVCRMTEEQVGRAALPRVRAVAVEVGDQAGVVADSLEFCLGALLESPPFQGARAVIERRTGDVLRLAWLEVEDGETSAVPRAGPAAGGATPGGGGP